MVSFRGSHLYLKAEMVNTIFGKASHALVFFLKEQNYLLVSPHQNVWFTKMYDAASYLLKERNAQGDKVISIRDIVIDNELDTTDGELVYDWIEKTRLLKIKL